MAHPPAFKHPLEWSDAFSVGHAVLDAEHRRLIASINAICALRAEDSSALRQSVVQRLLQLAEHHFEHESEVIRDISVGGEDISAEAMSTAQTAIRDHLHAHDVALAQLTAMTNDIENARGDELAKHCHGLKTWFVEHSIGHDAHLKTILQAL